MDRIPAIKDSWAKHVVNIGYFSDGTGTSEWYPYVYSNIFSLYELLNCSSIDKYLRNAYIVPNTTQGHCAKSYAILQKASNILKENNIDWLIISDDDTIFRWIYIIYN